MNHSTSKRTAKALPQQEATMLVEGIDKKIIKCTARKAFTLGNAHIAQGQTFFLVKSERRENRYYVVHFSLIRAQYQCSCGANCAEHAHLKVVREYVVKNVVTPAKVESSKQDDKSTVQASVIEPSAPLTAAQWKAIAKADKARQKAWADEYRQKAQELREAALATS